MVTYMHASNYVNSAAGTAPTRSVFKICFQCIGTTCIPDEGHGVKETSDADALWMKAAGLFTDTFTGGS